MMVGVVPASPDPDPEQKQEERDVTAHQDPRRRRRPRRGMVAAVAEIEEALSQVQLLRERISHLLGPAGPHPAVATGDAGRRSLAFLETELSITAAFLTTLSLQHLGDAETRQWLEYYLFPVLHLLVDRTLPEVNPSRHTLLQRASQCFHFHRRKSYSSYWIPDHAFQLYCINEHPFRYRHLLTGSDLGLAPHQLAEAGALLPLVGIDRPAKKIFRWFTHEGNKDMSLRVMSIVGPVGIGKTTLAVEVRNCLIRHQTSSSGGRQYFHCNIMAQASRGADRNILLLQHILSQVSDPAGPALSSNQSQCNTMELLLPLVSERLQDKRYFIIIDDLWEESAWEKIERAFPNNNLGSRILITTCVTSVAATCCSGSYDGLVHKMKPLNEIDSQRKLLSKAVGYEDGCLLDNMKLFCDETLRRCDGIPLFIIGMADWLKEQRLQQREGEDAEHERLAMYYVEQVPRLPERLEQALSSAFNNDFANDYLRLILLYLSIFPYGYKFEKDRLILKWIYDGPISWYEPPVSDSDYFSAIKSYAETFFSRLVDMNVITCVALNCKHKQDEAQDCQWQVNHWMQQFLASKSAEMGFFFTTTTLNLVAAAAAHHCNESSSRMPRRLALHHPIPQFPSLLETLDLSQTRSLYVSGTVSGIPLDKFVNLVLLDLEGWENIKDEDLLQVCRMFFLRYLSVRNTRVSKLPQDIKELRILGTLDVSYTQITELPLELFELKYLVHLDLRDTLISQLPKQIVGLERLQVLLVGGEGTINSVVTVPRVPDDVRDLRRLDTLATVDLTRHPASFVRALQARYLRVLAVCWSFHQSIDSDYCEALLSSIKKWRTLDSLTIHCGLGCSMEFLGSLEKSHAPCGLEKFKVTAGRFASVPPWIDGLEHLSFVQISICNKQTTTDDLKILGDLPKLQSLILTLDFIPEQPIVIETQGFSKLQRFSLDCILPWLTFQTGAMPQLTHLQLKFSSGPASEECVPSGITNLRRISEVVLRYSKWCVNSTSVKMTVKVVREQIAKHGNPIDLFISDIEDHDVQAVDEETESATGDSSSGTDTGPGRDDAQAVDEVATGLAQSEITEAEC